MRTDWMLEKLYPAFGGGGGGETSSGGGGGGSGAVSYPSYTCRNTLRSQAGRGTSVQGSVGGKPL